jgi:hypothetical protein
MPVRTSKLVIAAVLLPLLLLVFSACATGAQNSSPPPAAPSSSDALPSQAGPAEQPVFSASYAIHRFTRNNAAGLVDTRGKILLEPRHSDAYVLTDAAEGNPRFLIAASIQSLANDLPTIAHALFSTKGERLFDFEDNVVYSGAFGSYLIKNNQVDPAQNAIIDMRTLAPVEKLSGFGAAYLTPDRLILLRPNESLEIYSHALSRVADFKEVSWAFVLPCFGQWFVSITDFSGNSFFVDSNGKAVPQPENANLTPIGREYAIAQTVNGTSTVLDDKWQEIFTTDQMLLGFLKKSAIASIEEGGRMQSYLVHFDGTALTKGYENLWMGTPYEENGVTQYIAIASEQTGITQDGQPTTQYTLLDPNGKTVATYRGVGFVECTGGRAVMSEMGGTLPTARVSDYAGNTIIPEGTYVTIAPLFVQQGSPLEVAAHRLFFDAMTLDAAGTLRHDVLDRNGVVLFSNLESIESFDGENIVTMKDGAAVLLDSNGNTLFKDDVKK